ncbi:uncharacterized protein ACNS7B_015114 [Menidia menidia]
MRIQPGVRTHASPMRPTPTLTTTLTTSTTMLQQNNNNNHPCLGLGGPPPGAAPQGPPAGAGPGGPAPDPGAPGLGAVLQDPAQGRSLGGGGRPPPPPPPAARRGSASCPRPADVCPGWGGRRPEVGALVTVATLKTSEGGGKTQTQTRCLLLRTEKGSCLYSAAKPGGGGVTAGEWLRVKAGGGGGREGGGRPGQSAVRPEVEEVRQRGRPGAAGGRRGGGPPRGGKAGQRRPGQEAAGQQEGQMWPQRWEKWVGVSPRKLGGDPSVAPETKKAAVKRGRKESRRLPFWSRTEGLRDLGGWGGWGGAGGTPERRGTPKEQRETGIQRKALRPTGGKSRTFGQPAPGPPGLIRPPPCPSWL